MKHFFAMVLALLTGLVLITPQHAQAFSCWRHIYNNSDCAWTFSDTGGGSGNAYFIDPGGCTSNCTEKNGPCTVNPHCTIDLQYTYSGGITNGTMNVTLGQSKSAYSYQGDGVNLCPYINHNGQTGGIWLNQPAHGDMTAGNCDAPWPPANKSKKVSNSKTQK
jgi:hypothetical protein